jgi:hypothetical protein
VVASVSYQGVTNVFAAEHFAVNEMTLDIIDSEFTVLVGPSGCGKTTALVSEREPGAKCARSDHDVEVIRPACARSDRRRPHGQSGARDRGQCAAATYRRLAELTTTKQLAVCRYGVVFVKASAGTRRLKLELGVRRAELLPRSDCDTPAKLVEETPKHLVVSGRRGGEFGAAQVTRNAPSR